MNQCQRSLRSLAGTIPGYRAGQSLVDPRDEPIWAGFETSRDTLIELSFKSSNKSRANPEPQAKPESSQVNQWAESRFEPTWDSNRADPVPQPEPSQERVQFYTLGSSETSRVPSRAPAE